MQEFNILPCKFLFASFAQTSKTVCWDGLLNCIWLKTCFPNWTQFTASSDCKQEYKAQSCYIRRMIYTINTEHKNKCVNNIHNRPPQTGEQKILTDNPEKCSIKTRDDTMFAQKKKNIFLSPKIYMCVQRRCWEVGLESLIWEKTASLLQLELFAKSQDRPAGLRVGPSIRQEVKSDRATSKISINSTFSIKSFNSIPSINSFNQQSIPSIRQVKSYRATSKISLNSTFSSSCSAVHDISFSLTIWLVAQWWNVPLREVCF